jgi:hypothetical protein
LIEIIVVIVILSIVSAISIKFLVDSLKIYTMTVNQKTLLDEGKLALERMCRDIRDARTITLPAAPFPSSGSSITFTRTNGTGSTATDPVLDHADENIAFQWDGISGHPLEKVKQYPVNPTTVVLAGNVTAFTVTRGAANDEIQIDLTLSLGSGERVILRTEVYPKNLLQSPTRKNFVYCWEELHN